MTVSWDYWVEEPIGLGTQILPRKEAIYTFCIEGLIPMLQDAGYTLRYSPVEASRHLLRLLFHVSRKQKVMPKSTQEDYPIEQYHHFCFCLDTMDWIAFWETWSSLQDFHDDGYAYRMRFQLPEFVWSWLNLESSPSAVQLADDLEEEDYAEDVSKGKEDPYLQDTSKRDYQDRHWH